MMKAAFATAALVSLLFAFKPPASHASGSGQSAFLSTIAELRSQDPSLSPVRVRILDPGEKNSGCGPIQSGDLVAHYCSRDRTIYATGSTIALVNREFGSGGLRYLAAHELAHGRQHAVTGHSSGLIWSSVLDELQADCIAGAWLRSAYGYQVDSAAAKPIQHFAYTIGDKGFWQQDWHGNPRLRLAALNRGLRTGAPERCLSSSRFNYASLLEHGQAWLQRLQKLRQP